MSSPILSSAGAGRPQDLLPMGLPDPGSRKAEIREAATKFEGMLMATLFQTMRKTVEPSGLFGNEGQSRNTMEYLLDQAVSQHAMVSGKGWGLADRLAESWEKGAQKPVSKAE